MPIDEGTLQRLYADFDEAVLERTWGHKGSKDVKLPGGEVLRGVFGTGKGYDTTGVKYQAVVDRLNEVLGVDGWSASTKELVVEAGTYKGGRNKYMATVYLRLDVFDTETSEVIAYRECYGGHESATRWDACKGAFTNALKKTAAMLGVGAKAYLGTLDDDHAPPPPPPPPPPPAIDWRKRTQDAKRRLVVLKEALGDEHTRALLADLPPPRTAVDLEKRVRILDEALAVNEEEIHPDPHHDIDTHDADPAQENY